MVTQKRTRGFLGKLNEFLRGSESPERHRSDAVQGAFRARSDVVQETVQADSTGMNLRHPCKVF